MSARAVFLDRDGVVNRAYPEADSSRPPASLAELELLPGALRACRLLHAAGFLLLVVTNQPDVGRGLRPRTSVEAINQALRARLALDDLYVCYHDGRERCACRKPKPGLLLQAAARWRVELDASFMVGDRPSDIEAGRRAGCTTVLVGEQRERAFACRPDLVARDLLAAVPLILERREEGR